MRRPSAPARTNAVYTWPIWTVVLALLASTFVANEIGYRLGHAMRTHESERSHGVADAIKASVLGLAALLLAFSYTITSSHFAERERLVLDEANAIGTCYLRAGLLTPPTRDRMRRTLERYTDLRIAHFERALVPGELRRTSDAMDAALQELWALVEEAARTEPDTTRNSMIVPAANEVIDLSATRAWITWYQMPATVLILLALCMIVSSLLSGHSSGQAGRRHFGLWASQNVLVALVLFVVLDFDRPRHGFIQTNHRPLLDLRRTMTPAAP